MKPANSLPSPRSGARISDKNTPPGHGRLGPQARLSERSGVHTMFAAYDPFRIRRRDPSTHQ